ncbi:MAG: hypothetical protein KDD65_15310 [Bacteroidetes bacterium]|nr:hypothetical protein [Bacteroidota bacterium]
MSELPKLKHTVFETIRDHIQERFTRTDESEYIQQDPASDDRNEQAFTRALEHYARSIPLDVALDGWRLLHIARETQTSLHVIGLSHVLPVGELPVEFELTRQGQSTRYQARVGVDDDRWRSLTESKRWKAVYLHATSGRDEDWNWAAAISGVLDDTPS